ncbi:protein MANBAL isoform X2 [Echeneis naucrates]|uniref:protein MANBAL isoform X2 n=1 Tax=Echeneis naucrates TaxID=173247 RepID=UPI0011142F4A|nr:protein MANBAL isoform X2 [Echeneis naucrates]
MMSTDPDLSPPEVPEPTFLESLLRYGLFLGAIFQLICILAVIFPTSKVHEQETESTDGKAAEQMKKPKGAAPQIRQKPKKESKKKR